jgi:ATP-dependent protease HslVU (ClpYQ) peptidase subunit
MTTIIGITNGKQIFMAGDKSASDGSTTVVTSTPKVYRVSEDVVVGFAGDWRGGQLGVKALMELDTNDPSCGIEEMTTAIAQAFVEADYKNEETTFLIGYGGQLFEIQPNLGHIAIWSEFHAIGDGASYALGALHCMHKPYEFGIRMAFMAAARWTNCTADYNEVSCG